MTDAGSVIEDIGDLLQHVQPGWIYRGERCHVWTARSSVDRCCAREGLTGQQRIAFETELLREFRRAYHLHGSSAPESQHTLEWLALMQHHGAPTRLLDFTYSVFVAAFFAVELQDPSSDCCSAIWAISTDWLLECARGALEKAGAFDEGAWSRFCRRDFDEEREQDVRTLFFGPSPTAFVCHVNPFRLNERLRAQQGVFLIQGDVRVDFSKNMATVAAGNSDKIRKLRIPASKRGKLLVGLEGMNISRASLFPGLDGYAESLATNQHFVRSSKQSQPHP